MSAALPLLIGVTGHTDLRPEDEAPLTARVTEIFQSLRAKYPQTPLTVVSPLAEGADRLVARAALDSGIRVIAPLPLDPPEYRRDFGSDASVAEFDGLLARAANSFLVPATDAAARTRPKCYAHVGAYVARHCHVLLALWSGRTPDKIGGTAEIVRYRLEGMADEFDESVQLLEMADVGLVYQIVTPRRSEPPVDGTPYAFHVLAPDRYGSTADAERAFDRVCSALDAFNRLAQTTNARIDARRSASERSLLGAVPATQLPQGLETLRKLYACADEAAIRFQRRTRWTLISLFWLGMAIVVGFELVAHGSDVFPSITQQEKLGFYLSTLLLGVAIYAWAIRRRVDQLHLDYRALAEALRVECYWRIGKVRSVAADYCMRYHVEEMEWIRLALRSCEVLAPAVWTSGDDPSAALRTVTDDWVQGQHDYFVRAAKADHARLTRLERLAWVFLGLAFLAGAAVTLSTYHMSEWMAAYCEPEPAHAIIVSIIGLAIAAAALIRGYAEQRALSVHIKRYDRMRQFFAAALKVIAAPLADGDWATARRVLSELGREALEENADWVMLHRERPIELPT